MHAIQTFLPKSVCRGGLACEISRFLLATQGITYKNVCRAQKRGRNAYTSAMNDSAGLLQDDEHDNRGLENLHEGLPCSTVVNPGPMDMTNGTSRNIINIAVLIVLAWSTKYTYLEFCGLRGHETRCMLRKLATKSKKTHYSLTSWFWPTGYDGR